MIEMKDIHKHKPNKKLLCLAKTERKRIKSKIKTSPSRARH